MTYCFAFNPGKGLRWAPPPFSKLLNFFICNVFKMLYEKVIILLLLQYFLRLLLSLLADDAFLLSCYFILNDMNNFLCLPVCFLLFVAVMLLLWCLVSVYLLFISVRAAFFSFCSTFFWIELLHVSVDISDSLSLDVSSGSLLS